MEAFQENDAVFHKLCIAEFNKQKLLQKRKHQQIFDDEEERSSNKENIQFVTELPDRQNQRMI